MYGLAAPSAPTGGTAPDRFIRNEWYAAATSDDVGRALTKRTILGDDLVLFRTEGGQAVALLDRCPHRFAPLSFGTLKGDMVECGYHGLSFDCEGRCVRAPGQVRIPPGAVVRRFPVIERYGLVFVWTGDAQLADPVRLINIAQYEADGWGVSRGYHHFGARYLIIIDNLIDPAHTSFVHRRTIGNAAAEDVAIVAEEQDDVVCAGRWINDAPPVPIVQRFAAPKGNVDRWQHYYLKAPSVSWVDFGSVDAGSVHTPELLDQAPYRVLSYAFLTPETSGRTHYCWFQLRNFRAHDAAVTAEFEDLYRATFDEDKALLEAIERTEQRHPDLKPVRIASDAGVVRMRRILERRLDEKRLAAVQLPAATVAA